VHFVTDCKSAAQSYHSTLLDFWTLSIIQYSETRKHWTTYVSAVQRSYVLGHNSLMPMEVRAPPHYCYLTRTIPTPTTTTTTTTTTNNNNNSIQFFIFYVLSQQLQGQLQTQHSTEI
jgi:hypothetical protein